MIQSSLRREREMQLALARRFEDKAKEIRAGVGEDRIDGD